MPSLKGKLLLAAPAMQDPNFARSVVLIIKHDSDGALGLILNHPTGATVREAIELNGDSLGDDQATLFRGGPCDGPLMVLHERPDLAQETIIPEGSDEPGATPELQTNPGVDHPGEEFPGAGVHPGGGVYFTVEPELVRDLLTTPGIKARYFHGYAGWAPNQLDAELQVGGWLTIDASAQTIFDPDVGSHAWTARLKERTREALKTQINPNLIPPDPSVN